MENFEYARSTREQTIAGKLLKAGSSRRAIMAVSRMVLSICWKTELGHFFFEDTFLTIIPN